MKLPRWASVEGTWQGQGIKQKLDEPGLQDSAFRVLPSTSL